MKRLWCALWGHVVKADMHGHDPAMRLPDCLGCQLKIWGFRLGCPRCSTTLGRIEYNGDLLPFATRATRPRVTIGPLRRFLEGATCFFLGHDDQWYREEARMMWYQRCDTCWRELPEPRIVEDYRDSDVAPFAYHS